MVAAQLGALTVPFTIAAVGSLCAWFALVAVVSLIRRPHDPDAHPGGLELGGDSPPAVAGMLVHNWKPPHVAATATLLDLAARGILAVEDAATGGYQVRIVQASPGVLAAFERQVYDLVVEHAAGSVVPGAALTLAEGEPTDKWFATFGDQVRAEARSRGLSQRRFGFGIGTLVVLAALVPAACTALAAAALFETATVEEATTSSANTDALGGGAAFGVMLWIFLVWLFRRLSDDRDTPAGLAEAGRWLGLRDNLGADTVFAAQHVTAVKIWDRLMAYGIALGVARVAADDLPIAARSRHEAWSAETGTWRLVHIRYPQRIPPGYGETPWKAVGKGLFQILLGAVIGVAGTPAVADLTADLLDPPTGSTAVTNGLARGALDFAAAAVAVVGVALALRGLFMLMGTIVDLAAARTVEGRVLRLYGEGGRTSGFGAHAREFTWQIVVDDGSSDRLRAWYFDGDLPFGLAEGSRVRASVGPWLAAVRDLKVIDPERASPASEPDLSIQ